MFVYRFFLKVYFIDLFDENSFTLTLAKEAKMGG